MLTKKQKKLLRRGVLYSSFVRTEIIMALILPFIWMVLIMIDDLFLEGPGFFAFGFWSMPVFVMIYLILLIFQGIYIKVVVTKKDWMDMAKKADIQMQDPAINDMVIKAANAGIVTLSSLGGRSISGADRATPTLFLFKQMRAIHDASMKMCVIFKEKIPNRIPYLLVLILIPLFVMIGSYTYRYIDVIHTQQTSMQVAQHSVDQLVRSFEPYCTDIYGENISNDYDRSGYSVHGYLTDDRNDTYVTYISVNINNEGVINEVDYYLGVDVNDTKENNIERVQKDLKTLHTMLVNADVDVTSSSLLVEPVFTQEYLDTFRNTSYYENTGLRCYTDDYTLIYITTDQEDYALYGESYFNISMEEE